ncbi:MAG: class I SAM-dependent methyltransferase [Candidatus Rokubacteria bacterium]|nr:class I SAM-dependent methyltransferase [Candidatus Rokubacteria bacterium]
MLSVSRAEIERTFAPFVTRSFEPADPEWRALVRRNASRQRARRRRRQWLGWLPRFRRTQQTISDEYSRTWSEWSVEDQITRGPVVPFVWGERCMMARAIGAKRVHLLLLTRLVEALQPKTVLEVGSGNGLNLFVLAARLPDVRFFGVELTAGGVAAARALARQPALPPGLGGFCPDGVVADRPFDRISVVRGSAADLPIADRSMDLVFTVLALEQMEEIRPRALAEIARVTRGHVAMIEPFRDWNSEGATRDYVVANDYFAGRIAELPGVGLEPVHATDDVPSKLALRAGLVVSRACAGG